MKINLISLGCPKNLIDSEIILGELTGRDVELVRNPEEAETIIINTCGFIQSAKEESIETILKAVNLKKQGRCKRLFVTGCLSQRYRRELEEDIPEVDAFFGVRDIKGISQQLSQRLGLNRLSEPKRVLSTPPHYAYLKIAEGCDRPCSFCVIPQIRGRYRSRDPDSILQEAKDLAQQGVRELIVVAQDTTYYGTDLRGDIGLTKLVERLCTIDSLKWIRLLYTYPSEIKDDLINLIADSEKICKYLDLPVQHISDKILKAMRRGTSRRDIENLIEKLRKRIPNLALRTTLIVGFPGEEEEDFEELLNFVRETRFERLGVFTYSREEGTPAFSLPDQIPEEVKQERFAELMRLQQGISREINRSLIGKEVEVLVDGFDHKRGCFVGRTQWDCPEVDNSVILQSQAKSGEFRRVKVIDALEYDLIATTEGVSL